MVLFTVHMQNAAISIILVRITSTDASIVWVKLLHERYLRMTINGNCHDTRYICHMCALISQNPSERQCLFEWSTYMKSYIANHMVRWPTTSLHVTRFASVCFSKTIKDHGQTFHQGKRNRCLFGVGLSHSLWKHAGVLDKPNGSTLKCHTPHNATIAVFSSDFSSNSFVGSRQLKIFFCFS